MTASTLALRVRNPGRCSAAVVGVAFDGRQVPVEVGQVRVRLPKDGARHELVLTLGARNAG